MKFEKMIKIGLILMTLGSLAQGVQAIAAIPAMFPQKTVFTVNGKEVSAQEAVSAALASKEVFKCQNVVLVPSKSGTSVSLRAVKKARAE